MTAGNMYYEDGELRIDIGDDDDADLIAGLDGGAGITNDEEEEE